MLLIKGWEQLMDRNHQLSMHQHIILSIVLQYNATRLIVQQSIAQQFSVILLTVRQSTAQQLIAPQSNVIPIAVIVTIPMIVAMMQIRSSYAV